MILTIIHPYYSIRDKTHRERTWDALLADEDAHHGLEALHICTNN